MVTLFKNVKFLDGFESVWKKQILDYMFRHLDLTDKNDAVQKGKRSKLWNAICKWVWQEINKLRSNRIASFYGLIKSK